MSSVVIKRPWISSSRPSISMYTGERGLANAESERKREREGGRVVVCVRACVLVKLYAHMCAQPVATAAALARVCIMHIERLYYMRARARARS